MFVYFSVSSLKINLHAPATRRKRSVTGSEGVTDNESDRESQRERERERRRGVRDGSKRGCNRRKRGGQRREKEEKRRFSSKKLRKEGRIAQGEKMEKDLKGGKMSEEMIEEEGENPKVRK
ncbi:Hypothetical predicted protein [Xyrichtys novacula]|uniref:Uncharacterized protein n=1 Tax=Xyrichtys novacula TaxID=13765 RepID=A0AAV1GJ60_XYRNO|nr:Hypothetical predicted protein [Xyrichtys novacula]